MTDEILEKAQELKEQIDYLDKLEDALIGRRYARIQIPKKRSLKILFGRGSLYSEFDLPREVQSDLFRSVSKYKEELKKEYNELGQEDNR